MSPRDTALIARWVEGRDADAFAELVTLYQDMVFGVASRILRNDTDAADVTQECFLRLALKPPKSSEYLGGWLHRVVTNLAIDAGRRSSRSTERERQFAKTVSATIQPRPDDLQRYIDEAINTLPAPTRDMIVAHYLERRGHAEIAADFGVSKQAVTRRIGKGIESIRQTLGRAGVTISAAGLLSFLTSNTTKAAPVALAIAVVRALSSVRVAAPAAKAASMSSAGLSKLFAAIASAAAAVTVVVYLIGNQSSKAVPQREQDSPPLAQTAAEAVVRIPPPNIETKTKLAQANAAAQPEVFTRFVRDSNSGEALRELPVEIRRLDTIKHVLTKTDKAPNLSGSDAANVESIAKDLILNDEQRVRLPEYMFALDLKLTMGPPLMTLTSDANGAVDVRGLSPGEYVATVDTAEYATTGRAPFPVEGMGVARVEVGTVFKIGDSAANAVPILVQRKSEVTGRVYDYTSGAGVSGVTIQLRQTTPNHPIVNVPMAETKTDSSGNFRFSGVRPGDCLLWRSDVEGYVGGNALVKRVLLSPGTTTKDANFVLSAGSLLAGTVFIGGAPAKNTPLDLLASGDPNPRRYRHQRQCHGTAPGKASHDRSERTVLRIRNQRQSVVRCGPDSAEFRSNAP